MRTEDKTPSKKNQRVIELAKEAQANGIREMVLEQIGETIGEEFGKAMSREHVRQILVRWIGWNGWQGYRKNIKSRRQIIAKTLYKVAQKGSAPDHGIAYETLDKYFDGLRMGKVRRARFRKLFIKRWNDPTLGTGDIAKLMGHCKGSVHGFACLLRKDGIFLINRASNALRGMSRAKAKFFAKYQTLDLSEGI